MTATNEPRRTTRVSRAPGDVAVRSIAGETLLVPIRGHLAELHKVFFVNPVGEHVWAQLDEPRTVDELVASVVDSFAVETDQAAADVREFVAELVTQGLAVEGG